MGRSGIGFVLALLSSGCASPLDIGLTWEDAGRAAGDAITNPVVWGPAAGAALFAIDDWDHRAGDWAVRHTPVFGSPEDAEDASDILQDVSIGLGVGVPLLAPEAGLGWTEVSDADEADRHAFAGRKAWRTGLGLGAMGVTSGLTTALKDSSDRVRPDGSSDRSFPSAHASTSGVSATLALGTVAAYELPRPAEVGAQAALVVLPYATGWARVEAERHYPSDVLAGIALGNFFAAWVDALLDPRDESSVELELEPTGDGVEIGITMPAGPDLQVRYRRLARLRGLEGDTPVLVSAPKPE